MSPLPSAFELEQIMAIREAQEFNDRALQLFYYQRDNNSIYRTFLNQLGRPDPCSVYEIPCLPIGAFKHHKVISGTTEPVISFASSGTSGQERSWHHLLSLDYYEQSFLRHFEMRYGSIDDLCILGLLPSYIEQGESSLVHMVDSLITRSRQEASGTYLNEHEKLRNTLLELQDQQVRTILFGVSYALLNFVEEFPLDFPELIVIETGGMKGRRKEIIREELHELLQKGFGIEKVHSEYGMTELLSQAYSAGEGVFRCPPWMQVRVRDITDPLAKMEIGKTGGLDIIDLANVHSCCFISTDDLGRVFEDGSFEVLGRFDQSDIRGCSLMV